MKTLMCVLSLLSLSFSPLSFLSSSLSLSSLSLLSLSSLSLLSLLSLSPLSLLSLSSLSPLSLSSLSLSNSYFDSPLLETFFKSWRRRRNGLTKKSGHSTRGGFVSVVVVTNVWTLLSKEVVLHRSGLQKQVVVHYLTTPVLQIVQMSCVCPLLIFTSSFPC